MMTPDTLKSWIRFAEVFNDLKGFPSLAHVAVELSLTYQTVRNKSAIARQLFAKDKSFPQVIIRSQRPEKVAIEEFSPAEHAKARATSLSANINDLITGSDYPVVNSEAVVVESFTSLRYDRSARDYVDVEGVPRTWLSDTLRVAPVVYNQGRRFIFTGAQNDAPVHEEFWINLKTYARRMGAEIVIGPWTYETSWWSESNPASRSYDPKIVSHMCFGQMAIGDNFIFAGEMNTMPTASRPISDLQTYSRGRWAVFPHAKLQLKSIPSTDPNKQAHQVMTTGAVTKPKVIPRKAGIKAIFHHVIGAVIVEFDKNGDVFCRQINATDDGSFQDLDAVVANGKVSFQNRVRAVTCGDIHRRKLDPSNCKATFGFDPDNGDLTRGSLIETLNPEFMFLHDIHDNESRNHHHVHDNAHSYEMAVRGRENVMEEVNDAAQFLVYAQRPATQIKVVESNHDLALERYVREGRYRMDGGNIRHGLQLEDAYLAWREKVGNCLDAGLKPPTFSLLEYAIRQLRSSAVEKVGWVHDGQSFLIDGIECGHHGFRGANGSRGTISGYASMGRKMSIGDKHSPEIMDGVYCAGVMQLQHGYNKGPSGWAVAHIIQYPNGKRALVTFQNGKWRA